MVKKVFKKQMKEFAVQMMEEYAKTENLSSEQLNKIEEMKWIEMPEGLKLFAYDFCILKGFVFTGVGSK